MLGLCLAHNAVSLMCQFTLRAALVLVTQPVHVPVELSSTRQPLRLTSTCCLQASAGLQAPAAPASPPILHVRDGPRRQRRRA